MAETAKFYTQPVYQWWLRINHSKHEGVFPSLGGTVENAWAHVEVSTVRGLIPMFQNFTSGRCVADKQRFALQGHDVGPIAPHYCVPLDNTMLGVTLPTSSCKWPFPATRRKAESGTPCTFQQLLVPYLHCQERDSPNGSGINICKDGNKLPSVSTPSPRLNDFLDSIPGIGLVMIPTSAQTVQWSFGWGDFLAGALNIAIDAASGYAWKQMSVVPTGAGLQPGAARRLTMAQLTGAKILDSYVQGLADDLRAGGELTAPFKLATFELGTGKLKVLVWDVNEGGWTVPDWVPDGIRGTDAMTEWVAERGNAAVLDELLDGAPHAA
jgi:hypothetical protein